MMHARPPRLLCPFCGGCVLWCLVLHDLVPVGLVSPRLRSTEASAHNLTLNQPLARALVGDHLRPCHLASLAEDLAPD